ncbi:MAG: GNAT family N-acetyltransferase [Yoonia sp.]|nr:GNAT family N-acetyltransferase [Yoonia sp.]MDG1862822.1 GNAT family N-acetyltransferase [Yoonia sp.]
MDQIVIAQPSIETTRFVLRPPRKSDAGLITMYASDERIARGLRAVPHPLPPGSVEAMITRALNADRTEDVWIMDGAAHGFAEAFGVVSLDNMDRDQSEIFYWVAPAFWNIGLATEAVRAIISANPRKTRRFFAEVFQDNPGSARVLTNCGFEYLGDAEAFSVSRNATMPTWTYTLKTGL